MRRSALLVSLLSASLVMAGCATNGYSNTAKGAAIGGVVGAVAGKATGNHKDKRLVIGAAIGALTGAAVGSYMDKQEKIYLEIYSLFEQCGIEFAYPTRTLFIKSEESISDEALKPPLLRITRKP